jgi:hypothetical protein
MIIAGAGKEIRYFVIGRCAGHASLAAPPIGGPPLEVGDRKDDEFVGFCAVHNRKRKAPWKHSSRAQLPRRPEFRVRRCKSGCCLDRLAEAIPEAFLLLFVVRDLFEESSCASRRKRASFTS